MLDILPWRKITQVQWTLHYPGFMITIIPATHDRTSVKERSAPIKFRYMITDYKHKRRTSTLLPGFETKIQLRKGLRTHALGIVFVKVHK